MSAVKWARVLIIIGLVMTVVGAVDPLEGSIVILLGVALATLGAFLVHSRFRLSLALGLALVAAGVAALFGLSAVGGFGGDSGRSNWWAMLLLPYILGWLLALIESVRALREQHA